MKPGGIVALTDHAAASGGDTRAVVEKYHRIDPATARADFERAGFVVEGTGNLLANPADAHDLNVFDEKIRGKTDRFMIKLRKPAK
jgi:predicted methyltransferase